MSTNNEDKLILGGHEFTSRFILGSGKFSLDLVKACIEKADAQIITLALRRANEGGLANILDYIPKNVTLLPNTSGARNAEEAVRIARLSREIGCGDAFCTGGGNRRESDIFVKTEYSANLWAWLFCSSCSWGRAGAYQSCTKRYSRFGQ